MFMVNCAFYRQMHYIVRLAYIAVDLSYISFRPVSSQIIMSLIGRLLSSATLRKKIWQIWYPFLTRRVQRDDVLFLNYAFQRIAGESRAKNRGGQV